jgi:hypothetical protein
LSHEHLLHSSPQTQLEAFERVTPLSPQLEASADSFSRPPQASAPKRKQTEVAREHAAQDMLETVPNKPPNVDSTCKSSFLALRENPAEWRAPGSEVGRRGDSNLR